MECVCVTGCEKEGLQGLLALTPVSDTVRKALL